MVKTLATFCTLAACVVVILESHRGLALAATLNIPGDPGDGWIDVNGFVLDTTSPEVGVGTAGNNVRGVEAVYFFRLPQIPSPDSISAASLRLSYLRVEQFTYQVQPEFNLDLFGLGARNTATILAGDYYDGPAGLSTDALIATGIVTPVMSVGPTITNNTSLADYLRSLYLPDGTPAAPFAVFRVNPDVDLPPDSPPLRRYVLATADDLDSGGIFQPLLTLNVVPEPAGDVLICLGGAGPFVVARRRRRLPECLGASR